MIKSIVLITVFAQVGNHSTLLETVVSGSQKAALRAAKELERTGKRAELLPVVEARWKNSPVAGPESDGTFDEEVPVILFDMNDKRADAILLRHFMLKGIAFDAEKVMIDRDLNRYAEDTNCGY